jgi:hypothetical protein
MCAEGVIHRPGKTAIRSNPADLVAIGDIVMLGKKLINNRVVVIALAVIALMTLTAGVAAAASAKATNIKASGGVTGVALAADATVETKFKIRNGDIKSVEIKTNREEVGAVVLDFDADSCKEKGKHSDGACTNAAALLGFASIGSTHNSKARLNVKSSTPGSLTGIINGDLKSTLVVTSPLTGDVLTGSAKLKIRSKGELSTYACFLGVSPIDFTTEIYGLIQSCVDSTGPNGAGVYDAGGAVFGGGDYPFGGGPMLVPIDLHVTDKGTFKVESESTGTKLKGKIQVVIDVPPTGEHGPFGGTISITKGEATFPID